MESLLNIKVSHGEFFDRYTILLIKDSRVRDESKRVFLNKELDYYIKVFNNLEIPSDCWNYLERLREVNEDLWDIEDKIRVLEKGKDFGQDFIMLARSVYVTNDERARLKGKINDSFGSDFQEIKDYVDYE